MEVESSETKTTVILPDPFTDDEGEVGVDIDVAAPDICGRTLHWTEELG